MNRETQRTLRCLHSVGSLQRKSGGPAHNVVALCDVLTQYGADVEIVTQAARQGSSQEGTVLPAAARVTAVPGFDFERLRLSWSPGFGSKLARRCADWLPNIIHDHGIWSPINHSSVSVARRFAVPLILSPRGMLEPWALSHKAWKKRLAWRLYQRRDLHTAAVLHATAEQEARNFRNLGLRQPIAIIPNGVYLPALKAPLPKRRSPRTLLFMGRIHPVKGLVDLVTACSQALPAGWKVVIAGPDEGGYRRVVEAAIRHQGMHRAFEFAGPVAGGEKIRLYLNADLFVLPSFSENFGVVVAEALACEVPVVTTKGTPWQGLEREHCGWWVDIGVEPLAAAIRQATSLSDAERQAMGRRGRAYVEWEFGWPVIAEQMLAVYEWVLGQGPKPDWVITD